MSVFYPNISNIPKEYSIIYAREVDGKKEFAVDLGFFINSFQGLDSADNEAKILDDEVEDDEVEDEITDEIDIFGKIKPEEATLWKLERVKEYGKWEIKTIWTNSPNAENFILTDNELNNPQAVDIFNGIILNYKEELILRIGGKLLDFGDYENNFFNENRGGKLCFNPLTKLSKLPIFVLNSEKLNNFIEEYQNNQPNDQTENTLRFDRHNLQEILNLDLNIRLQNDALLGDEQQVTQKVVQNYLVDNLKKLARQEDENQKVYGKNLVYLVRGIIKYSELRNNGEITKHAPLFLVPVRNVSTNVTDPQIELEDYAFLNFIFDKKFNRQLKNFLKQEEFGIGELKDKLAELQNGLQNNLSFVGHNGINIVGFEDKNYLASLGNFNSVYTDKAWVDILKSQKIRNLVNANFGKEVDPENQENSLISLDPSQEKAMKYALVENNEMTVIKGPPGTGKSQVIVSILTQIIKNGKKAIFVSSKKEALKIITKKITEFESKLDQQIPENLRNNLKSMNDRILDLTNSKTKRRNYLLNEITEINQKNTLESNQYQHYFPASETNLTQYYEILRQNRFGNLTYQLQENIQHSLLSQMARYKAFCMDAVTVPLQNINQEINLAELKTVLDNLVNTNYNYFHSHIFDSLKLVEIPRIITILTNSNIQDINFGDQFIFQKSYHIADILDKGEKLLESLEIINIEPDFLEIYGNMSVCNYLNKLDNLVDVINKYSPNGEVFDLVRLGDENLIILRGFDLDVDGFEFEIPLPDFDVSLASLRQFYNDLRAFNLIDLAIPVSNFKNKLAESFLLTIPPNQWREKQENARFCVDFISNFTNFDNDVQEVWDFKNSLQVLVDNYGFGVLTVLEYSDLCDHAQKNPNFLFYNISDFKRTLNQKIRNNNLNYQIFRQTDFSLPDVFKKPKYETYTLSEIIQEIDSFFTRKAELENLCQPPIHVLKDFLANLASQPCDRLRFDRRIIPPELRPNLVQCYLLCQNPIIKLFPQDMALAEIPNWLEHYDKLNTFLANLMENPPYFHRDGISVKEFFWQSKFCYFSLKLAEITSTEKHIVAEQLENLKQSLGRFDIFDCHLDIFETLENDLVSFQQINQTMEEQGLKNFKLDENFSSVQDFIVYLQKIYRLRGDLENYQNYLNSRQELANIISTTNLQILEEKASGLDGIGFTKLVLNSVLETVENQIGWGQDNNQNLQDYKNCAENENYKRYLELRFKGFGHTLHDLSRKMNNE